MTFINIMFLIALLVPAISESQTAVDYFNDANDLLYQEKVNEAIELYKKAIELDPKLDFAHYNKGFANQMLRLFPAAIEDFKNAAEVTKNDTLKIESYIAIAWMYRNVNKNLELAIEYSQKALNVDSMYSNANHIHGLIISDNSDFERAIYYFDRAIKSNPYNEAPYYDRGISKRELQNYNGAIEDYNKAISLNPQYWKAYNNRGYVKSILNDYEGAIKDYNKVIDNTESSYTYNNRGFAKYNLGDFESAKVDCEKAVELDPENSWAYHYLGLVYYELGRKKEACNLFRRAYKLGKEDAMIDILEKCKGQ